jgi:ABC-type transport system substrate-binding protein
MRFQRGGTALRLAAGSAAIMVAAAACGSSATRARRRLRPRRDTRGIRRVARRLGLADQRRHRPVQHGVRPEQGADGGQAIVGDWQEATQFNPYYLTQVTEANVASATWATLATFTDRLQYAPDLAAQVPTLDNGGVVLGQNGDAMTVTWTLRDGLKWSDGEDLTCDDFKYATNG